MKSRRTDPTRRTQLVAQWRASGEVNAAFARRHGVHPRTFWGWCHEEPRDQGRPTAADVGLVPVTLRQGADEAWGTDVEIVLASGDRVSLRGALTGEVLAHVVTALRRPC